MLSREELKQMAEDTWGSMPEFLKKSLNKEVYIETYIETYLENSPPSEEGL